MKECAQILEGMKQWQEAAVLYDRVDMSEKAAQIFMKVRNLSMAGPLLAKIKSPKLQLEYAKAKEAVWLCCRFSCHA